MKRQIVLFSLILLSIIFTKDALANSDNSNLEEDLAAWKIRVRNQSPNTSVLKKLSDIDNISPSFTPIDKINPVDLFSNKVSDPKIKALLEAAYKKPGALILHTSIE
jgi:hypothetical protein